MPYTFKRNYSNIDKLKYFTKMTHCTIKLYYNLDNDTTINIEGISKNGSIIKMNNALLCIANLNDILLRSIVKKDINYKNRILGVIIGHFTMDEFQYYCLNSSELPHFDW